MQQKPSAVIIGAGVAGLAASVRLAIQGFDVKVFEQSDKPGGKLGYFETQGYHFDTGPSLFTQPDNIEELFALANEPIESYFSYRKMPDSCTYFYEDGTVVRASADIEKFAATIEQQTGEPAENIKRYLSASGKLYENVANIFLNHSLHKRSVLWKSPIAKALKTVRPSHIFKSLHRLNSSGFREKKVVQLFNRYATYNGSNPYKAPGMLSLIPHLEHNEGTFYPEGGMISITHALFSLAQKKGVQFFFNQPVERIIRYNNQAKGVVVDGKNIEASIVISNVDAYFTYMRLLNDQEKARKILKQERSSSALIFYWGIKKEFAELGLHNIFFSEDYEKEFDHIFRLKKVYADPTVYVNITSKCEPGKQAPVGKENWFVMINVPANIGQHWDDLKTRCRVLIIEKLNRMLKTDLSSLIETENILDPVLIETATGSYQGSLYGTSSNSRMAAFMRHPNFSRDIEGLYFVGGSVHPGGGIPLCLKSAKIMSELVQSDQQRKKHS
ncbi:1-hydroxycarotenoid 3,4-desaturase CrtD [Sediminibacterium goheungense]|uniref:Phytoene desaturase n=1 Tax=Sediminibacterium goheungense TaxID=1086393 RepID=A0A4R6IVL6_9BACT|nr:1-hydroxycarotenoid 3,4-desaturase CrtD [Sediminibacterium goheungense]TDO26672.1 phytoene desaturase [Sediminibacterium goheungense]